MWVDPVSEMVCCLFTTGALEESERLLGSAHGHRRRWVVS